MPDNNGTKTKLQRVKQGGLIKSEDWNAIISELERLETDKVNRSGDTIKGALTIEEALNIGTNDNKTTVDIQGKLTFNGDSEIKGNLSITNNLNLSANSKIILEIDMNNDNHVYLFDTVKNLIDKIADVKIKREMLFCEAENNSISFDLGKFISFYLDQL